MSALSVAAMQKRPVSMSYALMCAYLPISLDKLHFGLRVPKDCADAANVLQAVHPILLEAEPLQAETVLSVFQRCDAWRRLERWQAAWEATLILAEVSQQASPSLVWQQTLIDCLALDVAAIAAQSPDKASIPANIRAARLHTITQSIASSAP